MNSIYIGDRPLDPPENDEWDEFYCPECHSVFQFAECFEAHQESFADMSDPGEPNDPPDEG